MSEQQVSALLQARYGAYLPSPSSSSSSTTSSPSDPTIATLLAHRSVREFLPSKPLPENTIDLLVAAGQSAPTSSNLQTWSVIALTDPSVKDRAARLAADQDFIREAPLFLVFCADLQRLTAVSRLRGTAGLGLEYTDTFLMAAMDAALASQNVVVAAEALGLGACHVGAVRNRPHEMAELLGLPHRVIALVGLAIGWPKHESTGQVKPRLGADEVLHRERWGGPGGDDRSNGSAQQEARFSRYDDVLATFNAGEKREGVPAWTERSAKRMEGPATLSGRHIWREALKERGFDMK
ncbi:hypothetical protein M406DRAFT_74679 [Cryphonectria parasitica EP155]|uniref:Nitroreductase domain-containing protein n=1 Tax=Cryphonectria parasitica (strain ATCC 38755 / EP155) TaxID=660469 RepID=A0A9P4XVU2_CRYP1|nr:uncharacterized protein M406DRAFT_74679 [Cryphonectria parasitica EP155]KAF3761742.1 hypothetical protein M406DRAFT_74679 [Cryphonectria parasitica EP155]